jgi:K+-transporting ATPase KdpF subunit
MPTCEQQIDQQIPHCRGKQNGPHLHRIDLRFFCRDGVVDSLLRRADGKGRQVMNWAYWLSGAAALGIFVYLIVALFKPELFE